MGIFKRISALLRANITDLLDKAQDPEKVLNQLMIDLREEKRNAQKQVVRCIADEKMLEQQVRDSQEKLTQWQRRAEVAVMRDEDDLAREAIGRRNEYAAMVDVLTRQWEEQHQTAEQLRDGLDQLERRYKEAEMKKQQLMNQHRAAVAQKKASEVLTKLSESGNMDEFARVQQRILETGAMASASVEMQSVNVERQFEELESGGVVEHDLIQLKAQMGKLPPQLSGANGNGAPHAALPGANANGPHPNGAAANGASPAANGAYPDTAAEGGAQPVERMNQSPAAQDNTSDSFA